jgi:hypothetical protein
MEHIDLWGFDHSHVPLMYDRDGLHCGMGAEVDVGQDRIFQTHLGPRLDTFDSGGENVVETLVWGFRRLVDQLSELGIDAVPHPRAEPA